MSNDLSRRRFVAVAAWGALAAASPALAATPTLATWPTPIARLHARVRALDAQLAPHAPAISAALRDGGVPGWMRLKGQAYAWGENRYGLIVQILNATPTGPADLDIQRRMARDVDMAEGPRDWAQGRIALAERALASAA